MRWIQGFINPGKLYLPRPDPQGFINPGTLYLPRPDGRGKYNIPGLINPGIHQIESH